MKSSLVLFIVFLSIVVISAQNIPQLTQGGVLKFSETSVERQSGSTQNTEQVILAGYLGQPLKALQFNIIVGKNSGNLILKSVTRGSGIPSSAFLFDYEIYKGQIAPNGSSIDTIKVVFLGNGTNALLPDQNYHIISITYDVAHSLNTKLTTRISFDNVIGATSTPVNNANVIAGDDAVIHLIAQESTESPKINSLQNYPNPFNPNTIINYVLNKDEYVTLKIFNSIGEEIESPVNEFKAAGNYEINFDARDLPSGVYFCRVQTESFVQTRKMILMR